MTFNECMIWSAMAGAELGGLAGLALGALAGLAYYEYEMNSY